MLKMGIFWSIFYFLWTLKVVETLSSFETVASSVGFGAMSHHFETSPNHHTAWYTGPGVTHQYCGSYSTSYRSYGCYLEWSPTFQVSNQCRWLNLSCSLPQHWVTPTGNTKEFKALSHIQIGCICLRTDVKILVSLARSWNFHILGMCPHSAHWGVLGGGHCQYPVHVLS